MPRPLRPRSLRFWLVVAVSLMVREAAPSAVWAADAGVGLTQEAKHFRTRVSREIDMNYLLHLPTGYETNRQQRWPLLVFLHGAGEKGNDAALVAKNGPPSLVRERPEFPFILLSPQCPFGRYTWIADDVVVLIREIQSQYRVDPDRVYLTGLSMGGYGCWTLAGAYPELFAAVAPLCGGGDEVDVAWAAKRNPKAVSSLPIWAFHGRRDPIVPLSESEDMVKAFQRAGCREVKLTVYPEAGHDCWTETYRNPALYDWFLSHRRE